MDNRESRKIWRMALWEVKKSGRGQVIDLAQYEAVAHTNGNTLPLYTGEGAVYGHTGNRPPGFQPYDKFRCLVGGLFQRRMACPLALRCGPGIALPRSRR
jgi:CoA-transferase family III